MLYLASFDYATLVVNYMLALHDSICMVRQTQEREMVKILSQRKLQCIDIQINVKCVRRARSTSNGALSGVSADASRIDIIHT